MRILFMIFNVDYGKGGHFHSLLETVSQVHRGNEVKVISFGLRPSPVLSVLEGEYLHIDSRRIDIAFKKLFLETEKWKADAISCFDAQSYFFGRIVSFFLKLPITLTRCGGPNPTKYYPKAQSLLLYSLENKYYFQAKKDFQKTNFYLVPNRVSRESLKKDYARCEELLNILPKDRCNVLRINRFTAAYKKTMFQTMKLVERLEQHGLRTNLIIVGVVQDPTVFDLIDKAKGDNVYLFTDDHFTHNASSLLSIADVVVGTGRSFMEAALLGKCALVPTDNLSIPTLVDRERFDEAFKYNFSPRYCLQSDEDDEVERILANIGRPNDIVDLAEKYFLSDSLGERYSSILRTSQAEKLMLVDWFKNYMLFLRYNSLWLRNFLNKRFGL